MAIEILFFGSLTDATTVARLIVDGVEDTDQLRTYLMERYPALRSARYFVAVNQRMIQQTESLRPGDVVALMPPFSGG
ncbi:MAG: MoaD/ThiS family protein [Chitinophagaceae bacterium]|nr:MoaD/ThiS family protein [Chitinophagaceae bacterium]MCA6453117.1 MoaD/ThiS family protein [Chitinophagaceae bacterium]MCA6457412.1 MoaD/ThiS family protein [Chitinophagaceae bacterium]MCA6459740.1 MoaD/ThiS family protein [Chitinophagaceae bacterium]MCA6466273.1 MoaD/ThiS family protein [Chitinophagaceae bacterium]